MNIHTCQGLLESINRKALINIDFKNQLGINIGEFCFQVGTGLA
jgi:hypothetical protein